MLSVEPMAQPAGMLHQIPSVPSRADSQADRGMRMTHRVTIVMRKGIMVSPAPRGTAPVTNIVENTR